MNLDMEYTQLYGYVFILMTMTGVHAVPLCTNQNGTCNMGHVQCDEGCTINIKQLFSSRYGTFYNVKCVGCTGCCGITNNSPKLRTINMGKQMGLCDQMQMCIIPLTPVDVLSTIEIEYTCIPQTTTSFDETVITTKIGNENSTKVVDTDSERPTVVAVSIPIAIIALVLAAITVYYVIHVIRKRRRDTENANNVYSGVNNTKNHRSTVISNPAYTDSCLDVDVTYPYTNISIERTLSALQDSWDVDINEKLDNHKNDGYNTTGFKPNVFSVDAGYGHLSKQKHNTDNAYSHIKGNHSAGFNDYSHIASNSSLKTELVSTSDENDQTYNTLQTTGKRAIVQTGLIKPAEDDDGYNHTKFERSETQHGHSQWKRRHYTEDAKIMYSDVNNSNNQSSPVPLNPTYSDSCLDGEVTYPYNSITIERTLSASRDSGDVDIHENQEKRNNDEYNTIHFKPNVFSVDVGYGHLPKQKHNTDNAYSHITGNHSAGFNDYSHIASNSSLKMKPVITSGENDQTYNTMQSTERQGIVQTGLLKPPKVNDDYNHTTDLLSKTQQGQSKWYAMFRYPIKAIGGIPVNLPANENEDTK